MDSEVIERLEILYNSQQISSVEMQKTIDAVKYVEQKYRVNVEKETGGMFATHFAKSINRISSGEGISDTIKEVCDAVNDRPDLIFEAKCIMQHLLGIESVPEGEAYFTAMYIKLLLEA